MWDQGIVAGVEIALGVPVNFAGEIMIYTIAGMLFMMIIIMVLLGLQDLIKKVMSV
jgi:hypothetical protein